MKLTLRHRAQAGRQRSEARDLGRKARDFYSGSGGCCPVLSVDGENRAAYRKYASSSAIVSGARMPASASASIS
jgi:hypothetical protein